MENISAVFATLAEPIRLRCLALIAREGELCVCELVAALDLPQPKVSRHLAVLREAGLLCDRRDAQWVLYALAPDMPKWVRSAVDAAISALSKDDQHLRDRKRLTRVARPARARAARVA